MELKHTKGEWGIIKGIHAPKLPDSVTIIESGRAPICIVTDNWITEGTNEANARLICAAPEMLEALISAVNYEVDSYNARKKCADMHNNSDGVGIRYDYMGVRPMPDWVINAQVIIKKATE